MCDLLLLTMFDETYIIAFLYISKKTMMNVCTLFLGGTKLIFRSVYPLGSQGGWGGGVNRAPVIAPQWLELLEISLDTRPYIQDKH